MVVPSGLKRVAATCPRGAWPACLGPVARAAAVLAVFLSSLPLALAATRPAAPSWEPVSAADLTSTASFWQPDADLEYLFWRVKFLPAKSGVSVQTQIRAKIYTARGVEKAGQFAIEAEGEARLFGLAARVVKPDGTAIELRREDFNEVEVAKLGRRRIRETRFAFPNLQPGDVVEYRWEKSDRADTPAGWYVVQQTAPVREYTLDLPTGAASLEVTSYNVKNFARALSGKDSVSYFALNLPAYVEEPHMPPELDARGWVLLLNRWRSTGRHAWSLIGQEATREFDAAIKPHATMNQKATALVAGAQSTDEKIQRLYDFCRFQIVNEEWSDDARSRERRRRFTGRANQSARETLQRGRGMAGEINLLFAALLRAAGFQAEQALCASNGEILNISFPQGWIFLSRHSVALRRAGRWNFYDPGAGLLPPGMSDRYEQGMSVLVTRSSPMPTAVVPIAPADASKAVRKGRFALEADGTLHGTVSIELTGHRAATRRAEAWETADEDLVRALTEAMRERLPGAEVTDVQWEKLRQFDGNPRVSFKVTVPGYAESAGQRLVFKPSFFVRGEKSEFTAPERRNRIYWRFGWVDEDDLEIILPAGFELEQASAPPDVRSVNLPLALSYEVSYASRRHTLLYRRRFTFDLAKSSQLFAASKYPAFRNLTAETDASDDHSIVLRPKSAVTNPPPVLPASAPASTP